MGKTLTQQAAIYTSEFCMAVLRGLRDQLKADGLWRIGEFGCFPSESNELPGDEPVVDEAGQIPQPQKGRSAIQ